MATVVYSMGTSLDGYVAGPDGSFDWSAPDEELHRFHNDRAREQRAQVMGRRLYETMAFWHTDAAVAADQPAVVHDFAAIWRAMPKVVVSTTLDEVTGEHTRLATRPLVEEVAALRSQPGEGTIGVGGAQVGAACLAAGLVDELHLFVYPVLTGGGTPFFGSVAQLTRLRLLETRTFQGGTIVHMRHRVLHGS